MNSHKDPLPSKYNPKDIEEKWYRYWEERELFKATPSSKKKPFCIVIPPPNITGSLHTGHALNNTLQDIIIREKKLQGYETLWLPGVDHAGIATQNKVEEELAKEGKTRFDLGREKFLERVWRWKERYGDAIIYQLKRMGCACDWSRLRFTLDKGLSKAVREAFCHYYEKGLIYRGKYIINWCPRCGTALSDLEVRYKERQDKLYYIRYPFKDREGYLTVATTRPETMLGDTAVAVHPEDERYKNLIEKELILPLVERVIPVIGDESVDREFGTGAVKVTPFHDPKDFEIGKAHNLEFIKVIDEKARITDNAPEKYRGLKREEARERILKDLKEKGLLEKIESYTHSVGRCARCETIVEPLVSLQWFVRTKPLIEPAIRAVKEKKIQFIPERWAKVYLNWMENIKDWCISRQLWWGHRIPVFYCNECGEVMVKREDPEVCDRCGSKNIHQDPDVLDTWFSSALWPFSTLGWPEKTLELERFYPTDVLSTDPDIIFLWVARMVMSGLEFVGDIPFRKVYIHSTVLNDKGERMSRSKGIGVDPVLLFDKFGTDAVRFTLAYLESQSQSFRLWEERFTLGRNFTNKIWNAARLVAPYIKGFKSSKEIPHLTPIDRWILVRYNQIVKSTTQSLDRFNFSQTAQGLYQFFWHILCDWYLEFAKPRLYKGEEPALWVLYNVFKGILKLLHPFMPFITEELWHRLDFSSESILLSSWPSVIEIEDEDIEKVEMLKEVITSIRNIRSDMGIRPNTLVPCNILTQNYDLATFLLEYGEFIKTLAKVDDIKVVDKKPPHSSTVVLKELEIYLPLEGIIDIEKERRRFEKELSSLKEELKKIEGELQDSDFLSKAKPQVIEKKRERRIFFKEKMEKLERLYKSLLE